MSPPHDARDGADPERAPHLCIGIATGDDPDSAWFAAQMLRLYHPEAADRLAIVLIDQHPEGPGAARLRALADALPALRYVPNPGARETTLDLLARVSTEALICALNPRALPPPGALAALLGWFARHPATDAVIQAIPGAGAGAIDFRPIADPRAFAARAAAWRHANPQDALDTSLLVACRRATWRALPPAPADLPVPASPGVEAGSDSATPTFQWQRIARALRNPFDFFPGIFCLNLDSETGRWKDATRYYQWLGIERRVERVSALRTPENHHRGCTLSWRAMVAEAARRGYEYVLIFEDDARFLDTTHAVLREALAALAARPWDLFFLGAFVHNQDFPLVAGSTALKDCGPVTCTHALAVHRRAFGRILADIPPDGPEFDRWLAEWLAIDQYFSRKIRDGSYRAYITSPRVATQPVFLQYEDADKALAERYLR